MIFVVRVFGFEIFEVWISGLDDAVDEADLVEQDEATVVVNDANLIQFDRDPT